MTLKLSVIGTGYLGAVHAVCMADAGHQVIGVDSDAEKIRALAKGSAPFHEPGLNEMLVKALSQGSLTFTTDISQVAGSDVHFLCVGTPQMLEGDRADTTYLYAAARALAPYIEPRSLVVGKSTVPVGMAHALKAFLGDGTPSGQPIRLVWNPEFLREGHAVSDTLHPDRLVYGVEGPSAAEDVDLLDRVYAGALLSGTPRLVYNYATAELVKAAANAFLATKISFINAMAEVCDAVGADVTQIAEAIGHDDRIGRKFLGAGIGFGGGCLPKDIRAFMARASELGVDVPLQFLREVDSINLRCRTRTVRMAADLCGGSLAGKRVTVLGAAFKPDSDDVRDSPALDIAAGIMELGAIVTVHDPKALANAKRSHPALTYEDDLRSACEHAELVLLLTEWKQYLELDPVDLARRVDNPVVLDGRNALAPEVWRAAGWSYSAIGRPGKLTPDELAVRAESGVLSR